MLDIQQKRHRPSTYWKRIGSDDVEFENVARGTQFPLTDQTLSCDAVRKPGEEDLNHFSEEKHCKLGSGSTGRRTGAPSEQHIEGCSRKSLQGTSSAGPKEQSKANDAWLPGREPRRFHLAKAIRAPVNPQPFLERGIRKQAKHTDGNLAIFVERGKRRNDASRSEALLHVLRNDSRLAVDDKQKHTQNAVRCKRPIINAAERARKESSQATSALNSKIKSLRLENSTKKLPKPCGPGSEEFAVELQHAVLEEIGNRCEESISMPGGNHLRFRPKPPKPREQRESIHFDGGGYDINSVDIDKRDDSNEYVYDMFVKTSSLKESGSLGADSVLDPLIDGDGNRVGVLIIEDEEEALWETYADLEASDPDYNSEEQDENG